MTFEWYEIHLTSRKLTRLTEKNCNTCKIIDANRVQSNQSRERRWEERQKAEIEWDNRPGVESSRVGVESSHRGVYIYIYSRAKKIGIVLVLLYKTGPRTQTESSAIGTSKILIYAHEMLPLKIHILYARTGEFSRV